MDTFINECISSLAFKEKESSEFLIGLFNELLVVNATPQPNSNQKLRKTNSTISSSQSSLNNEPKSQIEPFDQSEQHQSDETTNSQLLNEHSSENYYLDTNECFNNLIQFEMQSYDSEYENVKFNILCWSQLIVIMKFFSFKNKPFQFNFKRENIKYLSNDYAKWFAKMNDLEQLMRKMVVQINEKRMSIEENLNQYQRVSKILFKELKKRGSF